MFSEQLTGMHYIESSIPFPANFGMVQQGNNQAFHYNRLLNNPHNPSFPQPIQDFTPQYSSSPSNNTTSDEADDNQLRIINERKQRRMISNRESARRSRMRKQKHLDELQSQIVRLLTEKHNLIEKLNHVCESHHNAVQENTRLKEEVSNLRQMLSDLQIASPFTAATLRDLEEITGDSAHLRIESFN